MGDLPKLPPGWRWWGPVDGVVGAIPPHRAAMRGVGALPGQDPHTGFTDAPDSVQRVADSAAALTEATLRAAIDHAATEAGVTLPEGYDVGAVLRDGVREHGWWWDAGGRAWPVLRGPGHKGVGVVDPLDCEWTTYGGRDPWHPAKDAKAAARALWDAVGPGGPMPPLPEVDP